MKRPVDSKMVTSSSARSPLRRKNLVNDDGASYPVGHWINAWEAGFATAEVAEILLKDTVAAGGFRAK